MATQIFEPFVSAETAAEHVEIPTRMLLELARSGKLRAYPIGDGARRTWRFRMSDVEAYLLGLAPAAR